MVFRYNILAAAAVASAKNDKAAAKSLFEIVELEPEKYRLGHTKASNDYIRLCTSREPIRVEIFLMNNLHSDVTVFFP